MNAGTKKLAVLLEERRFEDALSYAEASLEGGAWPTRRIACIAGIIAGSQVGANDKMVRFRRILSEEAEDPLELDGALQVASELGLVLRLGTPQGARYRFEREARRHPWIADMGPVFAAVEAAAGGQTSKLVLAYYSKTSALAEWQAGLTALSHEKWSAAETHLLKSADCYESVGLQDEATLSRFDLVLAALSVRNLRLASKRARTFSTKSNLARILKDLAIEVHTAFAEMDVAALERWIDRFRGMHEFRDELYVPIVESLRRTLHDRRARFEFLLCRPAKLEDAEGLVKVAEAADLPSQPPTLDGIKDIIELSNLTLDGRLKWRQGRLYLAAFLNRKEAGDGVVECIGAGQIFLNFGGAWHEVDLSRASIPPDKPVYQRFLVYRKHKPEEIVIELAGNSVLVEMRDRRVGRFITESRVLFLKIYGEEIIEDLDIDSLNDAQVVSNLLTDDVDGQYPFYENVVRPLVGGKEYAYIDEKRYDHIPLLDDFLGSDSPEKEDGVSIPRHLLPQIIDNKIGHVREQTIGAEVALKRFGFRKAGKYDALDGGLYLTTPLGTLVNVVETRDYTCRRQRKDVLLEDPKAHHATIAPTKREMADFGCVRALVRQDDDEPGILEVEEAAANALGLNNGEAITLLKPHTLSPEK